MRTIHHLVVAAAGFLLVAAPMAAELFTVELESGTEFETRYQPREAPNDSDRVMFITSQGNWISVDKREIAEIVSVAEEKGYGKVIDTTTIEMGVLPNDRPQVDPAAQQERQSRSALEDYLTRDYSVDQFVDPGEAGGGGVPALGTGFYGTTGGRDTGGATPLSPSQPGQTNTPIRTQAPPPPPESGGEPPE